MPEEITPTSIRIGLVKDLLRVTSDQDYTQKAILQAAQACVEAQRKIRTLLIPEGIEEINRIQAIMVLVINGNKNALLDYLKETPTHAK